MSFNVNITEDGGRLSINMPTVNYDEGNVSDSDRQPKETEMATGVASQVKEKSTLEKALARKKKEKVDPNIQIIMDIYGLTREEANKFLGNEGVGTGGVNEFEGT